MLEEEGPGPPPNKTKTELLTEHVYVPPHRLIHLDMKGAPASKDYLRSVLTLSASLGATGVLMEWEDMFPWSGRY